MSAPPRPRRRKALAPGCRLPGSSPPSGPAEGLAATPPNASRAFWIVPSSSRIAAARRHDGEGVGGAFADLEIA